MKKIISVILLLLFIFSINCLANHIAGADLSYTCLGNDQYQVNLNVFVDCTSGTILNTQQTVHFASTCGGNVTAILNVINPSGTEISQLCPSKINNSTCNGGTLPGMWVFHYSGTVTLAPACDTWTMQWSTCCRNASIINLKSAGTSGIYIDATLNSVTALCNNSPSFSGQPIPYVCANQLVNYDPAVAEIDGDSLYYSLINARAAGPTILAYTTGYSAAAPISGIIIDPKTGHLTFTPTTIGNFVVVILVQEYNKSGKLIGTVMRDIQFVVQSCSDNVPDASAGAISNITGAIKTGSYSLEMCEGSSFVFHATYTDADAGDTLTLSSDVTSILPGTTLTHTGSNPVDAAISWLAPAGSANTNYTFHVIVNDGSCPIPEQQLYTYSVKVMPACPVDTSMLFIPNVFTPGGANPLFLIGNHGITEYSIQIFDRWGNKMFESTDENNHWNGSNASDGTYYYLIKAKGIDKKEYDKRGFLECIKGH